jgi:hypothetical protein
MGTSVGTKVFVEHGSRATDAVNLAWVGWQLLLIFLRGPHCARYTWVGWQGGMRMRKAKVEEASVSAGSEGKPEDVTVQEREAGAAKGDLEKGSQ